MPSPQHADLPSPSAEAQSHSRELESRIRTETESAGGWISFARYMELALYAPGLGYYSAGSTKLGRAGDFVTAPEFSSLFGRTLARQVAQVIRGGIRDILEVGAGSGALAADLLLALEKLDALPARYFILELSADLRERQRLYLSERVPRLAGRAHWVDTLPTSLNAFVIANEVLDAMPAHVIRTTDSVIEEMGVASRPDLDWSARPASGAVLETARSLALPPDYRTEVNLAARALVRSLGDALERGVVLVIDYGFPRAEYYHPQRSMGTLMCHYRHHSHGDPFAFVGLQDITTHVDFSDVAAAGRAAELAVAGYSTQAQFLVNCGITDVLGEVSPDDVAAYAPLASQAQKLLSPAEMGELFKVMALSKGFAEPLLGFARGDRSHTL
jgi:SAM-dependent MidA family methyltransferase